MTAHFTLKSHDNGYYELINGAGHYIADISTTHNRKAVHVLQGIGAMIGYIDGNKTHDSIPATLAYFCKQYDEWFRLVHTGVPHRKYVITDENGTVLIEQDCKDMEYEPFAQQDAPIPQETEPVKSEQAVLPLEELMPIQVVPLPGEVLLDKGIYAQMQGREWDKDCIEEVPIDMRYPKNIIKLFRVMREHGYDNLRYSDSEKREERIEYHLCAVLDALIANGVLTSDSGKNKQQLTEAYKNNHAVNNDALQGRLIIQFCGADGLKLLSDIMYNAGLMVQNGRRFVLVPA